MNIYQDAIAVQSACNVRGIIHSLAEVRAQVLEEMETGQWQGQFEEHPAIFLFVYQLAFLTRAQDLEKWQAAYHHCQERAKAAA